MTTPRLLMVMLALAFIDAGASQCPPEVPSVAAASPSCSLAISEKPETASILCSSNPFCEKNVCTNLVPPKANWPADFTSRFPGFPEKDFSSFVALCAYDQTCGKRIDILFEDILFEEEIVGDALKYFLKRRSLAVYVQSYLLLSSFLLGANLIFEVTK